MEYKSKHKAQLTRKSRLHWLFGVVVLGLLVVQVVVSNRLANYGTTLNQTEKDIEQLTQQNRELHEKIASASALMAIDEKARRLGFIKTVSPQYLTDDFPVALNK